MEHNIEVTSYVLPSRTAAVEDIPYTALPVVAFGSLEAHLGKIETECSVTFVVTSHSHTSRIHSQHSRGHYKATRAVPKLEVGTYQLSGEQPVSYTILHYLVPYDLFATVENIDGEITRNLVVSRTQIAQIGPITTESISYEKLHKTVSTYVNAHIASTEAGADKQVYSEVSPMESCSELVFEAETYVTKVTTEATTYLPRKRVSLNSYVVTLNSSISVDISIIGGEGRRIVSRTPYVQGLYTTATSTKDINIMGKLLERLPAIYRTKDAELGFPLRRFFMILYQGGFGPLKADIDRFTDLFDIDRVPAEYLDFLAQKVGFEFPPGNLTTTEKRKFVKLAPYLYARKGTKSGLAYFFSELTGYRVTIVEDYANVFVTNKSPTGHYHDPNNPGVDINHRIFHPNMRRSVTLWLGYRSPIPNIEEKRAQLQWIAERYVPAGVQVTLRLYKIEEEPQKVEV